MIRIQRLGRAHRERVRHNATGYTMDRLMARMRDSKATAMEAAKAQADMLQFLGISALEWQAQQDAATRAMFIDAVLPSAIAEAKAQILRDAARYRESQREVGYQDA